MALDVVIPLSINICYRIRSVLAGKSASCIRLTVAVRNVCGSTPNASPTRAMSVVAVE